jgi:uncharacterized phage-associated protein
MITEAQPIGKIDSEILAEYVLDKYGPMSHLKLQKLLYYIQGFHLAYFEQEIIEDDFQAWMHGPVSRKIYDLVKDHSILYSDVKFAGEYDTKANLLKYLNGEQLEFIDELLIEYSKLSGTQLERLTHSESPWLEARMGLHSSEKSENIISKEAMKAYYQEQLYGETTKA